MKIFGTSLVVKNLIKDKLDGQRLFPSIILKFIILKKQRIQEQILLAKNLNICKIKNWKNQRSSKKLKINLLITQDK